MVDIQTGLRENTVGTVEQFAEIASVDPLVGAMLLSGAIITGFSIGVFGIATLFGVGIEVSQSFVPYRQFEVADMVANAAGAALSCGWYGIEPRVQFVGGRGEDGGEQTR